MMGGANNLGDLDGGGSVMIGANVFGDLDGGGSIMSDSKGQSLGDLRGGGSLMISDEREQHRGKEPKIKKEKKHRQEETIERLEPKSLGNERSSNSGRRNDVDNELEIAAR